MTLSSCKSEVNYNVGFLDKEEFGLITNPNYKLNGNVNELIVDVEQLITVCELYENNAFDEEKSNYYSPLNTKLRSYNEVFFFSTNLIIITFRTSTPCHDAEIRALHLSDNFLTIDIKITPFGELCIEVVADWTMVIEVDKAVEIYGQEINLIS